ncbi:hypothetical protein C2G38_1049518 [Gigaspora rosea]|uniref:Uncharacterized protein n=1 Tax=Gigaspora rosea TaxID=44941 RepID=A0A397TW22_9GLOM|nr:hypothetical protein C2G38_1049518 [Gigaspora rosea]
MWGAVYTAVYGIFYLIYSSSTIRLYQCPNVSIRSYNFISSGFIYYIIFEFLLITSQNHQLIFDSIFVYDR